MSQSSAADWCMVGVTILGFGLTVRALYDSKASARSSTYGVTAPWIVDWDKTMLDHPDYREILFEPKAKRPLSDEEEMIVEYTVDTFDTYITQRTRYDREVIDDDWYAWMRAVVARSAVIREYFASAEHQKWYASSEFFVHVYRPPSPKN
jgi:hypothetical protein